MAERKSSAERAFFMEAKTIKDLQIIATRIRMAIIDGVFHAKSGHPGGSLSIADDLACLYWHEMNIDPTDPKKADRDRLVLSKGHAAPALYAALALRGYFSTDLIPTLRKTDSILQGHPDMKYIPGVDMSSGSLGQGISCAVGMALGAKLDGADWRVYTILGDGELQEGQVWEASMFAAAKTDFKPDFFWTKSTLPIPFPKNSPPSASTSSRSTATTLSRFWRRWRRPRP